MVEITFVTMVVYLLNFSSLWLLVGGYTKSIFMKLNLWDSKEVVRFCESGNCYEKGDVSGV